MARRLQPGPHRGRLPAETTSFLNRVSELADIRRWLSSARLVTLTGIGGTGKTRLAVRAAAEVEKAFADGVWLVEVGPLRDGDLLDHAIAETLGIHDATDRPLRQVLADQLRGGDLLLILDGCEQLLDATAELVESLLRSAPNLRVLCTSRQPLGLLGETVLTIQPLGMPEVTAGLPSTDLAGFPALDLFAERAAAAVPGFAVSRDIGDLVVEVCRRLDGLPLAIELAAAQLRTLSLPDLLAGLGGRAGPLTADRPPVAARHRLRETFDLSYALCSPDERVLWARLSVFAGSFGLDAVTGVCGGDHDDGDDLLEVVAGLVDKSVLIRDDGAGQVRYRLLDTVRQYGTDRLRDASAELAGLRRHRDWYADLAERLDAEWFGPGQEEWSARLRAEHDNLRAALTFSLGTAGEEAVGVRMAAALRFYWLRCGAGREGRYWLDRALAVDVCPDLDLARALAAHSSVLVIQSDATGGADSAQACLELSSRLDSPSLVARAATCLATALMIDGGEPDRIRALFADADRRLTALGQVSDEVATIPLALAIMALKEGQRDRAAELAARSRDYCRAHGEHSYYTATLYGSAIVALARDQLAEAEGYVRECLILLRGLGDPFGLAIAMEVMATVAAARGDLVRTATLLGAAHGTWQVVGRYTNGTSDFRRIRHRTTDWARAALGDDAFGTAFSRGAQMSAEQAIDLALDRVPATVAEAADAPVGPLTPREYEVARLIAEGLSNRQIGIRLVVSPRTVASHVENILRKLGFASRTQVAAWIARSGDR
jgi:non-specific serine/threonine protein kinase